MLTSRLNLFLNKPLLRHALGTHTATVGTLSAMSGPRPLPDLERVYLNRYALGRLPLVSWIDHIPVRGIGVVCALKQGRDFLLVVDAAQSASAFAHLIHRAGRFRVILKISLNLQEQPREYLRVALLGQSKRDQQFLIGSPKRHILSDEMHLLRRSASLARRVRPGMPLDKIADRLAVCVQQLVGAVRNLGPEPVIRDVSCR